MKIEKLEKICDLPEPVGDADTGEERFEAFQRYLAITLEASENGNFAEEIGMLEALNSTEHNQPAVYMNLFTQYSDSGRMHPQDLDKAFDMLGKTTALLVSPELALPSDPNSVSSSDGQVYAIDDFVRLLIHKGAEFIQKYRVFGKNGQELEPEVKVLRWLYTLSRTDEYNNVDHPFRITHKLRSEMLYNLGNICRKMSDSENGIECLRRSDYEMNCHYHKMKSCNNEELQEENPPNEEHNYDALLLILDIQMYDVSVTTDKIQQVHMLQEVVNEAYRLMDLMMKKKYMAIYKGHIVLGTMLYNQMQITKIKTQEDMKLAHKLLSIGKEEAKRIDDMDYYSRSDRILQKFTL